MPAASRTPKPGRVRTSVELDQQELTALKEHFGAKTETEALDRAMDHILFVDQVMCGLERLQAHGGLDEVSPDSTLVRMKTKQQARRPRNPHERRLRRARA